MFGRVFGQQDAQFSHYMFMHAYINPACTGVDNATSAFFLYRNQWTGLSTSYASDNKNVSPQSVVASIHTKIRQIHSGVGLFILNDWLGPLSTQNIKFSYSYHFNINEKLKLSLGLRGGYIRQYIETSLWRTNDPNGVSNDPRLSYIQAHQSLVETSNFDAGAGVFLYHPNYYAGVSFVHINNPTYISQQNYNQSKIYTHYFITGGYHIALNENFDLTPSIIIRDIIRTGVLAPGYQFDLSALLNYQNHRFWGGISYRHLDALVALVGIGLLKDHSLRIGYAFDLTVIGGSAKANTSHEIYLSYSKPLAELLPRPIIRTPRFRY